MMPPPRRSVSQKAGRKQRRFRERLTAYRARRPSQARRRIPRTAIPSFFTLMNLFCGFLALTQIYEGRFDYAGWLIFVAYIFDALDGMMARLTGSTSLIGVELDSLSDVVSFGVAPSYLVYVFGLSEFGVLGKIVAALPAICGAVRLARYNVEFDGEKKEFFSGLPIPIQAAAIVALVLNFEDAAWFNENSLNNLSLLIPIVVVLAALMVSNVPYDAFGKPTPGYIRSHPYKSGSLLAAILAIVFLQQIGLLIAVGSYIVFGLIRAIVLLGRAVAEASPEEEEGETRSSGLSEAPADAGNGLNRGDRPR